MSVNVGSIVKAFEAAQDNLVLQSADFSLKTISDMVVAGSIDASPTYQRRERWSPEAESMLIESFLLNVPVPPVYLAEDDFGTYSVIDGKQRITAISKFMTNGLTLKHMKAFHDLEGCRFDDLPRQLQNALSIRPYIRVVTLLKQSDENLKYEVFTRLNSGGEPLLPQEIRNALFRGPMNDAIQSMSRHPFLRQQLKIRTEKETAYTTMQDLELVLRFLTLYNSWPAFSGDMRRSMDSFMMANQDAPTHQIEQYKNVFIQSLERCQQIWGADAFKRPGAPGVSTVRDQFLSGLYDGQMIAVSEVNDADFAVLLQQAANIKHSTTSCFAEDPGFDEAVRRSTNTPSRLRYRIEAVKHILRIA